MSRAEDLSRGFGIVAKTVMRSPDLTGPAKALYAVLSTYANDGGVCTVGNERLAKDLGANPRSVQGWMKQLIEAKVVERRARFTEGRQTSSQTVLRDIGSWGGDSTVALEHDPTVAHGGDATVAQNNPSTNNPSRNNTSTRVQTSRETPTPEAFLVDADLAEWARDKLGIVNEHWLQATIDEFLDWTRAVGKPYTNWRAAIQNAIRREAKAAGGRPAGDARPVSDEELEEELRRWLYMHPVQHPPEREEELTRLMADDSHAYQREMEPIIAAWRERGRREVAGE